MTTIKSLKETMGVNSLVSAEDANPKVAKSGKLGVRTAVLHLAPADLSGYEVCPMRSKGCTAACLHSAGNPAYFMNKNKSRIARTKAFFEHREEFMNLLMLELVKFRDKAHKDGFEFAGRLNGTSDIVWESIRFNILPWVAERTGYSGPTENVTILEVFADEQWYDYTKRHNRRSVPSNYHLTFSLNETNKDKAELMLKQGTNVAVVFAGELPETYLGVEVIDGDQHDYRPQDPRGVVVGLKAKGAARSDDTGFTILL